MVPGDGWEKPSRTAKAAAGLCALLGAVSATTALSTATASAAAAPQVYVALGDSMASGPLIPDPTGELACARSTHNYAHDMAATLGIPTLRDVTCSGASTTDMTNPQSLSIGGVAAGTAPPQFDALSPDTTLVTLTIGGNDVGLVGVGQDCMQLNPFAAPCKGRYVVNGVDSVAARTDAFAPKLAAVLDGIHQRSPLARVLVTGYGLYIKAGGCWPVEPVLGSDATWLQSEVDYLNTTIATTAAGHGATYVDVRTPSAGHDSCQAESARWVEGYVPLTLAAPLHPNQAGEAAYARIVGAVVANG
ncbi:SGNH/GDSL hydrolase family protein [Catenulispora subtropica]|uniref:SGNH/GDSL hydrolase family protein n=1 Tax=Catenulispora subtropica TaxID=450798 RepID=A0ABN2SDC4_9ACTN